MKQAEQLPCMMSKHASMQAHMGGCYGCRAPWQAARTAVQPPVERSLCRVQAEARIAAALATNAAQLRERRAAFDARQAHNEERRRSACVTGCRVHYRDYYLLSTGTVQGNGCSTGMQSVI